MLRRQYCCRYIFVFFKVGRCASEEVIIKLISTKCLPVFVYGLDCCPVSLTYKRTLDFIMTRAFMRIFKTNSIDIIRECESKFCFRKVSDVVVDRKRKFLQRYVESDNFICQLFAQDAKSELLSLV